MRTVVVNLLATYAGLVTLLAGQLDVAVIQFPEQKSLAELQSAFATVNLLELTDSDRTRTTNAYLKGGNVLFAQRLPAVPDAQLRHSNTPEKRKRQGDRSFGSRLPRAFDLAHGGHQSWIADISEKNLHRLWSASGWTCPGSRCSPGARTFSQRRQGSDENAKLFSNDSGCRAICSLSSKVSAPWRSQQRRFGRSLRRLVSSRSAVAISKRPSSVDFS